MKSTSIVILVFALGMVATSEASLSFKIEKITSPETKKDINFQFIIILHGHTIPVEISPLSFSDIDGTRFEDIGSKLSVWANINFLDFKEKVEFPIDHPEEPENKNELKIIEHEAPKDVIEMSVFEKSNPNSNFIFTKSVKTKVPDCPLGDKTEGKIDSINLDANDFIVNIIIECICIHNEHPPNMDAIILPSHPAPEGAEMNLPPQVQPAMPTLLIL